MPNLFRNDTQAAVQVLLDVPPCRTPSVRALPHPGLSLSSGNAANQVTRTHVQLKLMRIILYLTQEIHAKLQKQIVPSVFIRKSFLLLF